MARISRIHGTLRDSEWPCAMSYRVCLRACTLGYACSRACTLGYAWHYVCDDLKRALSIQVGRKVGDVFSLIANQQEPLWRNYAMYMFAIKVWKRSN
jgi:hypothetical protein